MEYGIQYEWSMEVYSSIVRLCYDVHTAYMGMGDIDILTYDSC